ncbi:hypothetical protein [Mesorhizobium sp. 43Arga]
MAANEREVDIFLLGNEEEERLESLAEARGFSVYLFRSRFSTASEVSTSQAENLESHQAPTNELEILEAAGVVVVLLGRYGWGGEAARYRFARRRPGEIRCCGVGRTAAGVCIARG